MLGRRGSVAVLCAVLAGTAAQRADAREPSTARSESAYSALALPAVLAPLASDGPGDWDPLESVNRGVFSLNGVIDVFAIEPAARGWRAVTPQGFRDAVERFFDNLEFPVRLLGCLTQGRIAASGQELGRFLVNSTAGVAGLFDPASRIGLEPHKEDLGKSLGIWGLGPGPYLVIPVLGSSSTRDLVDLPLRSAGRLVPGLNLVSAVNTRSGLIAQVDAARAASLDLYLLARRAYFQSRRRPGRAAVLSAEASGG